MKVGWIKIEKSMVYEERKRLIHFRLRFVEIDFT